MGGPGSGRRSTGASRPTTDDYRLLDVRRCAREGLTTAGVSATIEWRRRGKTIAWLQVSTESDRVILRHNWSYQNTCSVLIERTLCSLGGSRPWFICPAPQCGRRVAILYCGALIACRLCHRLAYASTREDSLQRGLRRAGRIRARLEWNASFAAPLSPRPKWMRWRTYAKLVEEHDRLVGAALAI